MTLEVIGSKHSGLECCRNRRDPQCVLGTCQSQRQRCLAFRDCWDKGPQSNLNRDNIASQYWRPKFQDQGSGMVDSYHGPWKRMCPVACSSLGSTSHSAFTCHVPQTPWSKARLLHSFSKTGLGPCLPHPGVCTYSFIRTQEGRMKLTTEGPIVFHSPCREDWMQVRHKNPSNLSALVAI